jgi:hypothetical protein
MKVRETEIACWTVFHFIAPLMKLAERGGWRQEVAVKIQGFGKMHKRNTAVGGAPIRMTFPVAQAFTPGSKRD